MTAQNTEDMFTKQEIIILWPQNTEDNMFTKQEVIIVWPQVYEIGNYLIAFTFPLNEFETRQSERYIEDGHEDGA